MKRGREFLLVKYLVLWAILLTLVASCSTRTTEPQQGKIHKIRASEPFSARLAYFAGSQRMPDDLHILVECRTDDGANTVNIYGSGTTIWHRNRQVILTANELRHLLVMLQQQKFAEMPGVYGGPQQPVPLDDQKTVIRGVADFQLGAPIDPRISQFLSSGEQEIPAALIVTCRIAMTLDGADKQVIQRLKGRQSEEFHKLASSIIHVVAAKLNTATSAENLNDGLHKLAAMTLGRETLTLLLNKRNREKTAEDGYGWYLRIESGTAIARSYDSERALGSALTLPLDAATVSELGAFLSQSAFGSLPMNIRSKGYTDLVVQVLDKRHSVQARDFSGAVASTKGREKLQLVVSKLRALQRRVIAQGY